MNRCITTSTSLYFLSFPINTRKNITFYQLFYAISHNHSSSFFFDNSFFKKKVNQHSNISFTPLPYSYPLADPL